MRLSLTLFASALVTLVSAQVGPNAFNIPLGGYFLKAGEPTTFTWSNQQGSTVTLRLRDGANGALNEGTLLQGMYRWPRRLISSPIYLTRHTDSLDHLPNTGSYTYTPDPNVVEGATYTLEITNDQNPNQVNYTPQFVISSPVKAVVVSVSAAASPTDSTLATVTITTTDSSTTTTTATEVSSTESSESVSSGTLTSKTTITATSTSTSKIAIATTPIPSNNAAVGLKVGSGALALAAGVVAFL